MPSYNPSPALYDTQSNFSPFFVDKNDLDNKNGNYTERGRLNPSDST